MTLDRDAVSSDALLTDLYLDALLAGGVLAGDDGAGTRLDPAARDAADRLRRDLVRVHPSFRFEERLATRLAEAAVALRVPLAAGDEGRIVPLHRRADDPDGDAARGAGGEGDDATDVAGADGSRRPPARPLLIGGALTSAALSIAGAAWVAWRLGRPHADTPMARAARAVREARELALDGVVSSTTRPRRRRAGRSGRATLRRLN
jgi:hypothetical protein